jgi:hypothetical protein
MDRAIIMRHHAAQLLRAMRSADNLLSAALRYGFVTFADAATAQLVRDKGHLPFMNKTMNVSDAYRKHHMQRQGQGLQGLGHAPPGMRHPLPGVCMG